MNRRAVLALASSFAFAACATAPAVSDPQAEAAFDDLMDRLGVEWFQLTPESATYWGVPETVAGGHYNDRLDARGLEAREEARALVADMLARLDAVDPRPLDDERRLSREVLIAQFQASLDAGAATGGYGDVFPGSYTVTYPITQLSGVHADLPTMMQSQHPMATAQDAADYVTRLKQFGAAFDGVIEMVEHDAGQGAIPPDFVLEGAIETTEAFIEPEPKDNPLYTTYVERLGEIEPALPNAEALGEDALEAMETVVYPAYERLAAALKALLPRASHEAGLWARPNGEAAYQALIRLHADSTLTPQEIHDLGLAEVARIQGETDILLKSVGLTEGSVGERMTALGKDPRFVYPNTDEGRAELLADLNAKLAHVMEIAPQWFATVPTQGMEIQRIPAFREASAAAGYGQAPAVDGSRPGVFWINLRNTATLPSYTLPTLTYHEAAPGHLFQGGIAVAQTESPILRTMFAGSNAYVEGWALYSERLAVEMGLYEGDPYGDLGRLQDELHRAIRLVVDTGMHALRWSREEALAYMLANEGYDPSEAEIEIERYAAWPAQALGYKIGMLKILELRARAEAELGPTFDVKTFHDVLLLDGGLPLPVLEERVEAWISGGGKPR
jgi:uncharacterized protein (DUF885 family)